jgi:glycosyltransferase involved in cell wall biosynthesis
MTQVSVVIPTFNRANLLPRAIGSVLAQDHGNLEVIVVDDGSTDETPAVMAEQMASDPRVRYIRQDNAGAPTARNRGVQAARGDWIAFQDSDDEWAPGFLASVLPQAAANRVVFTSHSVVFRSGVVEQVPRDFIPSPARALRRANVVSTQTALLSRETARSFPFDVTLARFQDWDLWLTLLAAGVEFVHVPVSGATLYRQSDSISEGAHGARKRSLRRILVKQRRTLVRDPVAVARLLARAYAPDGWVSMRHRRRGETS